MSPDEPGTKWTRSPPRSACGSPARSYRRNEPGRRRRSPARRPRAGRGPAAPAASSGSPWSRSRGAHLRAADLHADLGQHALGLVDDPGDELVAQDVQAGTHPRSLVPTVGRWSGMGIPMPSTLRLMGRAVASCASRRVRASAPGSAGGPVSRGSPARASAGRGSRSRGRGPSARGRPAPPGRRGPGRRGAGTPGRPAACRRRSRPSQSSSSGSSAWAEKPLIERTWQRTRRTWPSSLTAGAGLEVGAQRALALVADEQDRRGRVVDEVAQVADDPAAGQHPVRGDDHVRPGRPGDRLRRARRRWSRSGSGSRAGWRPRAAASPSPRRRSSGWRR